MERLIPYEMTSHAEIGAKARGITLADIEHALGHVSKEKQVGQDVEIEATLPNGRILSVRTRKITEGILMVVRAYFLR